MSFVADIFGGGGKTEVIQPITPPKREEAQPAADMARRNATARGRAATILTDELGVTGGTTNKRRQLGVG